MPLNEWTSEDFSFYSNRLEELRDQYLKTHDAEERRSILVDAADHLDSMIELGQQEVNDLSSGKYVVSFTLGPDKEVDVEVDADNSPDAQTKAATMIRDKFFSKSPVEKVMSIIGRIKFMPDMYIMNRIAELTGQFPKAKTTVGADGVKRTQSAEAVTNALRREIINRFQLNIKTLTAMRDAMRGNDVDAMRQMAGSVKSQAFPTELVGSRKATEKEKAASFNKAEEYRKLGREARLKGDHQEAADWFELAKAEQERVPDVKFVKGAPRTVETSKGTLTLPGKYITPKPSEDAMFQVPLSFIHNMQLVGHELGATMKGGIGKRQVKGQYVGRRPFHLEGAEVEQCPICEEDFCRCCPNCHRPECVCEEIENERVRMISDFVPEDPIK